MASVGDSRSDQLTPPSVRPRRSGRAPEARASSRVPASARTRPGGGVAALRPGRRDRPHEPAPRPRAGRGAIHPPDMAIVRSGSSRERRLAVWRDVQEDARGGEA